MKSNYVKAKNVNTQKCQLCSNRNETVTHIISQCNQLAQKKYKTRLDWVGKEIHWELYKL